MIPQLCVLCAIADLCFVIRQLKPSSWHHGVRGSSELQVGLYQEAEEDGTAALQAGPNAKALLRRGTARSLMFKHQEAIQDFRHVLNLEPNNRYGLPDWLKQLLDDPFLQAAFALRPKLILTCFWTSFYPLFGGLTFMPCSLRSFAA